MIFITDLLSNFIYKTIINIIILWNKNTYLPQKWKQMQPIIRHHKNTFLILNTFSAVSYEHKQYTTYLRAKHIPLLEGNENVRQQKQFMMSNIYHSSI